MTAVAEGLQARLEQINAQVPAPVRDRIDAAIRDIDASGTAPGLSVGDPAPDFTLPDHLGRPVRLHDRLGSGPVVLVFYRGGWCPFCNVALRALQETLPQITAHGASLLAISPQAPDHALAITEQAGLDFEVLSDADQTVIEAYNLQFTSPADLQDLVVNVFGTDLRDHTADGSWRLPVPATFVVDHSGVVRAAHVAALALRRSAPTAGRSVGFWSAPTEGRTAGAKRPFVTCGWTGQWCEADKWRGPAGERWHDRGAERTLGGQSPGLDPPPGVTRPGLRYGPASAKEPR